MIQQIFTSFYSVTGPCTGDSEWKNTEVLLLPGGSQEVTGGDRAPDCLGLLIQAMCHSRTCFLSNLQSPETQQLDFLSEETPCGLGVLNISVGRLVPRGAHKASMATLRNHPEHFKARSSEGAPTWGDTPSL